MNNTLRGALLALLAFGGAAGADGLQVLHWWKSASERKAVDLIATKLKEENINWRDSMIPGGSGVGAGIVLRSRLLANDAPEVAQVNGVVLRDWARLNLLLDLDTVAAAGKWNQVLQPTVAAMVEAEGHVYAAPVGIHRINMLFYNRKVFKRLQLAPPANWNDFDRVAAALSKAGIVPLAQSSEPWQVATLFETLVLSEGVEFYRALFVRREAAAYNDARLTSALNRLRHLKKWMNVPLREQSWFDGTRDLADGRAAMQVMGDWAKGDLVARGMTPEVDFGCGAVPGTGAYHLFDIDSLSMLATRDNQRASQDKLAAIIMSTSMQNEYNRIKGSIPVLRAPQLDRMDACGLASFKLFSSGPAAQVPSMVHRMAADEIVREATVTEVHRFFLDDKALPADTQRRLGAIARTSPSNH